MFIRSSDSIQVGDTVRLTRPIEMHYGTFTRGHKFRVTGSGPRGWSLVDDEGRTLHEVGVLGGNPLERV